MTADEDGLEALLRARYLEELRKAIGNFSIALGFNQTETAEHLDAVSRLFVRYDSFPAFSAWRTDVLRAELQETEKEKPSYSDTIGRAASPGMAQLRAVQILGGERTTKEEWDRLVKAYPGRRLKGLDHKWNLTEAELTEALR